MAADTKKTITEVQETFKRLVREADAAGQKVAPLDPGLATKIQRVKEGSAEVVKHIGERLG